MIKLKADIEDNESLASNKLVSALRNRIIELYNEKSKDKSIMVSAIVKGEILDLDISIGDKDSSMNTFRNTISLSRFRNEISSTEFQSNEKRSSHKNIMDKIMKIVMKEFPSLFHKSQNKDA